MELSPLSQYYLRKMLNQHEASIAELNQTYAHSNKPSFAALSQLSQCPPQRDIQLNAVPRTTDLAQALAKAPATVQQTPQLPR